MFILRVPGTVLRAMLCLTFISENGRKAAKMSIPGRAFRSRCNSSQLPNKNDSSARFTQSRKKGREAALRVKEGGREPRIKGKGCM